MLEIDENGELTQEAKDKYYKVTPDDEKLKGQFAPDFADNLVKAEVAEEFKAELNTAEEEVPK